MINQATVWLQQIKSRSKEWLENYVYLNQTDLIGLVVNSDYLKLLKINHLQEGQYEVDYFNIQPLPSGLVSKSLITDIDAVAAVLKKCLSNTNIKTKNVAMAVPRSAAIIKKITLNSRFNTDEIESRVLMEVGKLFPDLIDEIYIDFIVLGTSAQDTSKQDVMIVACRKNQLQPYIDLVKQAGLSLKIVDINYYAIERVFPFLLKQYPPVKASAILNINFTSIELLVTKDGSLLYTNETNYNGLALKELINAYQNNTREFSKTEALLKEHFLPHLMSIMQYFYTSKPNIRVERLFLADDCAALIPDLVAFIQRETGKETVVANPFKDMKISSQVNTEDLLAAAPGLILPCGVAMSKIV